MRGGARHFTHSKVMAWVAFDRAVRSIEEFGLDGPVERWRLVRSTIHDEVCQHGFDAGQNSFVQSFGATELDASLLLIPLVGFLPPDDERVRGTVAAIERKLIRNGLVMRYDTGAGTDGLPEGEGAFLACSFWLADNYALLGRRQEARALFERLLALRNDVGLLAEEYDPVLRRQLGNFPQAFSHLALINTAHNLASSGGPAHQRSRQGNGEGAETARRPQARRETALTPVRRRSGTGHRLPRLAPDPASLKEDIMFGWAIAFLIIALIAGVLGFGGVAGTAFAAAKIVFIVALIALVITAVLGYTRRA